MQNQIDGMLAGQFNAEDDLELNSEFNKLMEAANSSTESENQREKSEIPISTSIQNLPTAPSHTVNVFPAVPTEPPMDATTDTVVRTSVEETRTAVPS